MTMATSLFEEGRRRRSFLPAVTGDASTTRRCVNLRTHFIPAFWRAEPSQREGGGVCAQQHRTIALRNVHCVGLCRVRKGRMGLRILSLPLFLSFHFNFIICLSACLSVVWFGLSVCLPF